MRLRSSGLSAFVTVGSTKFDDLINEILTDTCIAILKKSGFNRVVLQTGKSQYKAERANELEQKYRIELEQYDYKSSIEEDLKRADLVIGHAGAGTCLEALRLNKRLLIVVNDTLMDDHQKELADQLHEDNYAIKATLDQLSASLRSVCDDGTKLESFPGSNLSKFEEIFNEALNKTSRL